MTVTTALLLRVPIAKWMEKRDHDVWVQFCCLILATLASATVVCLWWFDRLDMLSLVVLVFCLAVSRTVISTTGFKIVNDLAPSGTRSDYTGKLASTTSVASVVGGAIGPMFLKFAAAPVALVLDATLSLLSAVIIWPLTRRSTGSSERPADGAASSPVLGEVVRDPSVVGMWLMACVASLVQPVVLVFILEDLGVSPWLMGLVGAAAAPGGAIGGILVGRLAKRVVQDLVVAASMILSGASLALLYIGIFVPSVAVAAAMVFEFGTALFGTLAVAGTMGRLQERSNRWDVGRRLSVVTVGMETAAVPGLIVGGVLGAVMGVGSAVALSVATYVFAGAIVGVLYRLLASCISCGEGV